MSYTEFVTCTHKKTNRDYLGRVNEYPKAEAAKIAKQFGSDYWDGDRRVGYGGYHYDGRWRIVAEKMISHYDIKSGDSILDIGCGKGFLLYEFMHLIPGVKVHGVDISKYAIENSKEEIRQNLQVANANSLPYADNSFDFVFSITTLHNLYCFDLELALKEMQRVGKTKRYLCVESYRNEQEKANLLYWQLTCESFYTPEEWDWWFKKTGYQGDHEFVYFE